MLDVAIIGGGISGCSLLYQLSRYNLKAVLLEKENDVGVGTTKANSAIVHAGYDPEPGSLMAKYNAEGNRIIQQLCKDLDVHYIQTGSLVLGFDEADRATVEKLYDRGVKNGVPGLRIVEDTELHSMEPALSEKALFALYAPTGGVVSPWELASAQAESAVLAGAEVRLNTQVSRIEKQDGGFVLHTNQGDIAARFVVNAAGVHADQVSAMAESPHFTIHPNRGQYFLLDTTQGGLVKRVIFQCPTKEGKGILVAPTAHGNLIVGPNSEEIPTEDTATTAEGLAFVREKALKSVPTIQFRESIRNFSGVRAAADVDDFIVGESKETPGFFNIAGIRSPGLTAAPAIAADMVKMLEKAGLKLEANPRFQQKRSVLRFKELSPEQKAAAIQKNPLYGTIVCRCETITEGEIVDALHRPLPPHSLDAVKRRCTTGMGRCQGGFCGPRVQEIIARELGVKEMDVPLDREGMQIITGQTKEASCSHSTERQGE